MGETIYLLSQIAMGLFALYVFFKLWLKSEEKRDAEQKRISQERRSGNQQDEEQETKDTY